ncbi:MAG: TlpA family protein disulfide reductase [Pedobacter sp.]|nr:MAG: TlpA family protein disulfide reductase [Pedobacter sp.]
MREAATATSYFTKAIKQSKAAQQLAYQLNKAYRLGLGKPFPQGRYKNLKTHQLESIRPMGRYTLVEFWWSGCGICLQHIPQLRNLHRDYAKKGFAIIGISTDKTQQLPQLEKLLQKYGFNWPEYLDENRVNADQNGVLFYPTYLLLDASGSIVNNHVRLSELPAFLEKQLN